MAEPTNEPAADDAPEPRPARLQRLLGDRPISVFGVLLAGGAVLLVLLIVIVVTSLNADEPDRATCLGIEFADAERAIRDRQIRQMNVVTQEDDPERGPLAVTVDFADQTCRRLPEGVSAQAELYRIIGMATVYNQTFPGEQSIALQWETQANIPAELLATATSTPSPTPLVPDTATPAPTISPMPTLPATPPATATLAPTTVPTITPSPTAAPPTATSVPPTRPPASPTVTPRPTVAPTVIPTATPRATSAPPRPPVAPTVIRVTGAPTRAGTPGP